jgi:cyclopropane-fatty-acyl-phospholipid synthase
MAVESPVALRSRDAVATSVALIEELLGPSTSWGVKVRFWDGTSLGAPDAPATVLLRYPWSLRSMLWPPGDLAAGEAFIFGDVDVEGDLEAVFEALMPALDSQWRQPRRLGRLMRLLLRLPAAPSRTNREGAASPSGALHSLRRDRESVQHHYNVPTDFYQHWLDSRMQYSCGYFERPDHDLETAQEAKLEHICRKLRLTPGDRLLDIGCGWGGLLEYAADHFGVQGLGVTLSEPQAREANARFRRAGLADSVRAEVRDYRELQGEFDAITSVGMVEHVGATNLPDYFGQAFRLLKDGGVFLNHGITAAWGTTPSPRKGGFMHRYVFPDGELVPISAMLTEAERAGLEVRDVENLREHYAATLRHWVSNLRSRRDEAIDSTSEITYRVWLLYMAGSAYNFEHGSIGVCQSLLLKPRGGHSGLPPTRADWYVGQTS